MSIQNFRRKMTENKLLSANTPQATPWVRNPTWLPMPALTSADEEVAMLVAVYPESNFIAFTFNTNTAGNWTANWGDGTSSTGPSAFALQKQYDWSDTDLDGTDGPVTFVDAGDLVQRTAHGYTNGMPISFATVVTTTGITAGQTYYVINASADEFQVAATPNGSAIALTTNGTGTILPYKQAIIRVTPVTGVLSGMNLQVKHTQTNLQAYAQPILDLLISASLASSTVTIGGTIVPPRVLERCVVLRAGNATSSSSLFANCNNLQFVDMAAWTTITDCANMFQNCSSLASVPLFNTASVSNMASMFNGCSSLTSVPLFNTASVTSMSSMFNGCFSLASVPLFNTASVNNMASMFQNCNSLTSVPLFNTASVTSMLSMFSSCSSLTSVPLFNTASVTNMLAMFNNCSSLTSVPLFNTASVTSMSSMFNGCFSLTSVPLFNTASVTSMLSMFSSCSSLTSVPLFNTASVTNMGTMFNNCFSLTSVPLFNTASVNNMASMFNGCSSLKTVPLFNTVSVLTFNNMFAGCRLLISVPNFDTTATTGTNAFAAMFNNCSSLQELPAMNVGRAAVSSSAAYTNMFGSCVSLSSIKMTGHKFTFSVANCKLSADALDALYTNLATVTGQTITVSGNWGTATDSPSIATAKGWTVTG